jgi:general stress protein YciG
MLDDNENQDNTTAGGGSNRRGFASMDEDRQREIASKGGKAAHQKGTAHEFDSQEAAEAGRKGGQARQANRQESESDSDMGED